MVAAVARQVCPRRRHIGAKAPFGCRVSFSFFPQCCLVGNIPDGWTPTRPEEAERSDPSGRGPAQDALGASFNNNSAAFVNFLQRPSSGRRLTDWGPALLGAVHGPSVGLLLLSSSLGMPHPRGTSGGNLPFAW